MDIGIIGSGRVAQTLAEKLLELGHRVTISSRDTTTARPKAARCMSSPSGRDASRGASAARA